MWAKNSEPSGLPGSPAPEPASCGFLFLPCCTPQISKKWTHYGATALFFFFGARMLYDAVTNAHAGESELDEVEKELQVGRGRTPSSSAFCGIAVSAA